MRKVLIVGLVLIFAVAHNLQAQRSADPAFDRMMNDLIDFSVPLLTCQEYRKLAKSQNVVLLDSRESYEYKVSHIPSAKHIGFKVFNKEVLKNISKDAIIVIYSSVGERSEQIGEHLLEMGYKNVYNLYGGIFEWANKKYGLIDGNGMTTNKIHTSDKSQEMWLKVGEKIFD